MIDFPHNCLYSDAITKMLTKIVNALETGKLLISCLVK